MRNWIPKEGNSNNGALAGNAGIKDIVVWRKHERHE
jgi:hypothetical protein